MLGQNQRVGRSKQGHEQNSREGHGDIGQKDIYHSSVFKCIQTIMGEESLLWLNLHSLHWANLDNHILISRSAKYL